MSDQPRQPDLERAGVDPADALAFVEGGALDADRQARIERALERDAAFGQWLDSLRNDRALVREWVRAGDAQAPAGLADDAMAQAERDALVSADRPPGHRRVFAARGLALAALFAVAATASVFFWQTSSQQPPAGPARSLPSDNINELAKAPEQDSVFQQRSRAAGDGRLSPDITGSQTQLADARRAQSLQERSETFASADEAESAEKQGQAVDAAKPASRARQIFPASASGADVPKPDEALAQRRSMNILHLAREGQLALIARADKPAEFVAAFLDLVRQAEPGLRFHPLAAGADAAPAALGELTLPADAAAIEALRVMLTQIGAREARFVERDEPLSLPMNAQGSGPAWWRAPASRWTPRVVIELRLEPAQPDAP